MVVLINHNHAFVVLCCVCVREGSRDVRFLLCILSLILLRRKMKRQTGV